MGDGLENTYFGSDIVSKIRVNRVSDMSVLPFLRGNTGYVFCILSFCSL